MSNHSTELKMATCLRSMTGFAQTVVQEDGFVLTVNLRSVNHRALDLHVNLPEQLQKFEPAARREIQACHPRGHLQLKVTLEQEAGANPAVDEAMIGKYIELFRRVGERYGLPLEAAMTALPRLPGVIAVPGGFHFPPVSQHLEDAFPKALRETLENWDKTRAEEGMVLERDLRERGLRICDLVERMEQLRLEAVPLAQKKMRERLDVLLGQGGMDAARLAQEAALLAEHTDISEEVLRLKAHSAQFLALLDGQPEIGKKLDFLLQETQREINTLLAKTAGLGGSGLPMTQLALEIRGEVEKLREQALNVQ
jgi:uncharacterized protein (TIGR00255 family)